MTLLESLKALLDSLATKLRRLRRGTASVTVTTAPARTSTATTPASIPSPAGPGVVVEPLPARPPELAPVSIPPAIPERPAGFKFPAKPLDRLVYTQKFGESPDYYARFGLAGHNGVDFRTRFEDSPDGKRRVFAVMDGSVSEALSVDNGGYGKYVRLIHTGGSQTIYAHLDSLAVLRGRAVKAGDWLGVTDSTGASTGPHLHFGYRPPGFNTANGFKGWVDPEPFLS